MSYSWVMVTSLNNTADVSSEVSRQFDRRAYRVSVRAKIYPLDTGTGETARVCHLLTRDLSAGGISLISSRAVEKGQHIELEMPDGRTLWAECRWCGNTSQGMYVVGCRFLKDSD